MTHEIVKKMAGYLPIQFIREELNILDEVVLKVLHLPVQNSFLPAQIAGFESIDLHSAFEGPYCNSLPQSCSSLSFASSYLRAFLRVSL